MTTWSFDARRWGIGASLLALTALAGCDDAAFVMSRTEAQPLTEAPMAGGKITLVPPRGYCIDPANLRARFALMARCDTLAEGQSGLGAPLGILSVSFSRATAEALPSAEITAKTLGLENVSASRSSAEAVIFRAEGTPSIDGMGKVHWRGTARVGDQIMGLALYGAPDSRAISAEGRAMLTEVIAGTRAAE